MPQDSTVREATSRAQLFRQRAQPERHVVTLPSGAEIVVRKPDLMAIMRHKDLPHELSSIVAGMISQATKQQQGGKVVKVDPKAAEAQFMAVVLDDPLRHIEAIGNVTLMLCGIDPKFVDKDPEECADNEVSVSEVDLEDKAYLWNWAGGATSDAAAFRPGPGAAVEPAPDGEGVLAATQ